MCRHNVRWIVRPIELFRARQAHCSGISPFVRAPVVSNKTRIIPYWYTSEVAPTRKDLGGVSCTAIILSSKISNSCRYFFEIRCVPIWVLGRAFFRFDSVILLLFINVVEYYIIYCQIINTAFIMVLIFDLEKECVLMYILK